MESSHVLVLCLLNTIMHYPISELFLQAESQTIRANVILNRKREKLSRKYTPAVERRRQLSPGFLEDALDEV